jgi:hypothetical protein
VAEEPKGGASHEPVPAPASATPGAIPIKVVSSGGVLPTTTTVEGMQPGVLYRVELQAVDNAARPGDVAQTYVTPPPVRVPRAVWIGDTDDPKKIILNIHDLDGPATIDWGDGTDPTPVTPGATAEATSPHTFTDDGTYTVTVTLTADPTKKAVLTVDIISTRLDVLGGVIGTNWRVATLNVRGLQANAPTRIDWGDTQADNLDADASGEILTTHTYDEAGVYRVRVTELASRRIGHDDVMVLFPSPIIVVARDTATLWGATATATFDEGVTGDAHVDWGDGSTPTPMTVSAGTGTADHTYPGPGTYTVIVYDHERGMHGSSGITINPETPDIAWTSPTGSSVADKGTLVIDRLWGEATISFGDGSRLYKVTAPTPGGTATYKYDYKAHGGYTISVTDSATGSTATTAIRTSPREWQNALLWEPLSLLSVRARADGQNIRPTINWGDGTPTQTLPQPPGWMTHTYAEPGVYTASTSSGPFLFDRKVKVSHFFPLVSWRALPDKPDTIELLLQRTGPGDIFDVDWGNGSHTTAETDNQNLITNNYEGTTGRQPVRITDTRSGRATNISIQLDKTERMSVRWATVPVSRNGMAHTKTNVFIGVPASVDRVALMWYDAGSVEYDPQSGLECARFWDDTYPDMVELVVASESGTDPITHRCRGFVSTNEGTSGEFQG